MATVKLSKKQAVNTIKIEKEDFINTSFKTGRRIAVIEEILPFRIKFTAIQVPGYNNNLVPPIPLQIIGYSNYIL